ncbi:hypothetical protein [Clostridium sp. D46t1_190503_E9]|nr:hypothetical protein [Clostridium sp. D46t1_190503_E9]
MLKLKNSNSMNVKAKAGCGRFDANCIFCDGGWWDVNKSVER